ncbi:MAG TPA: sugar phosphate nucleotidyltransferase, partial [Verrucomicrobiae bacterium]|nr:sugar phosphate nucleotidyltransferase [Verrucomicrobiae bacterium]
MITPVILAGGTGTRLWPLSRELYPKQLLSLVTENSMLQETVRRVTARGDFAAPILVCNDEHRFIVAEQLRREGVEPQSIILEPVGRNTAPAVAIAALEALQAGDDPLLLVLPADHLIADVAAFHAGVAQGAAGAAQGMMVTFGIVPASPETGYGYIKAAGGGSGVLPVETFVEKPDLATAERYVASGEFYWNSGMFMFHARSFLAELERHAP